MEYHKPMTEIAVFGGGCFWCTEAVFKMMKGVSKVVPGYAGGTTENPTYEQVSTGETGHAECVRIEYDPALVQYRDLLTVFFGSHDPTTVNRQGPDTGTQYRSIVFYTTAKQREDAEAYIAEINASNSMGAPVVTELKPLTAFYEAENYHHDYFANHPGNPYCELVINPKLEKVQKQYADLLQDISKK
jgi:peptide-methionine (S)-S-oxide reductase